MKAHADQAQEHDEKQDDVGGEGDEDVKFGAVDVGDIAGGLQRYPESTDLRMDEYRRSINNSGGLLTPTKSDTMACYEWDFSVVYRRGEEGAYCV